MSFIIVLIITFGLIVSGILLLKQSAKKFHLSDEQLSEIKKRNEAIDKEDSENN